MKQLILQLSGACLLAAASVASAEKPEQAKTCYALETSKFVEILNRQFNQAGYLTDESSLQNGPGQGEYLAQFSYQQAAKNTSAKNKSALITLTVVIRRQNKQHQIKSRQLKISQTLNFDKDEAKQKETWTEFYDLHFQSMEQVYANLAVAFKPYTVQCS